PPVLGESLAPLPVGARVPRVGKNRGVECLERFVVAPAGVEDRGEDALRFPVVLLSLEYLAAGRFSRGEVAGVPLAKGSRQEIRRHSDVSSRSAPRRSTPSTATSCAGYRARSSSAAASAAPRSHHTITVGPEPDRVAPTAPCGSAERISARCGAASAR